MDDGQSFGLVGRSKALLEVLRLVRMVGPKQLNVLITGPSGTGKELVAKAIRELGGGSTLPFLPVNVSAIPDTLLEAELFGYHKGAFTGADSSKRGMFELAKGGIVFLDEIGDMSPSAQAKVLRALEEQSIFPLGATAPVATRFRIVAATSKDLPTLMDKGLFRVDLFHRLDEIRIEMPSLRERMDDLPLLVDHFLGQFCHELGMPPKQMSDSSLALLRRYSWPGNIRELRNLVKKAVVLTRGKTIWIDSLPIDFGRLGESTRSDEPVLALWEVEKKHIFHVLELCRWNKKKAAEFLQIDRSSLYNKMRKYGIDRHIQTLGAVA